jgi:DNA repair ATPase RecN
MAILEGDTPVETPQSGLGILDQWLQQLHQADNATDITTSLEQVKTQLKSDQINGNELGQLLDTLATQTAEFSTLMGAEGDISSRLEGLSAALRTLAGQLSNP